MATPEEQKATLHANRRARPFSPTPGPSPTTSTRPHDRRSTLQSSQLRALALAASLALAPSPSSQSSSSYNQTPQQDETSQWDTSSQDDSAQQAQAQQAQRLAGLQAAMSKQGKQQAQNQKSQQADKQSRHQQQEIKKVAKATMRRGAIYVTNLIASAIDMGSVGISFIVNVFFYLFSLGWLNLEMIYGKYFAKGKSKIVGPLSWDPIPMPVDKDALILSGFIIAADIALGLGILVLSFGGFCIIHDWVTVTSSVAEAGLTGAAQIGVALAQGESGGLCLGGIISSTLGP